MKVQCPSLSHFSRVRHAFFDAGVSPLFLKEEWAIGDVSESPLPLVTLTQVHGTHVVHVKDLSKEKQEGDGLVTSLKNIALGVLTADCGPVLFYDPSSDMVAACHAGWRGAKAGIIQATVQRMEDLGATRSQIVATLGPTIQQQNYEVGPEFPDLIGGEYASYFYAAPKRGFHYFNLPLYIQEILAAEGLAQVHDLKIDTFLEPYASRRRFLKQGEERTKVHNLSAIAVV